MAVRGRAPGFVQRITLFAFPALLLLAACGRASRGPVRSFVDEPFPEKLSEWRLFLASKPRLQPNQGVVPYDLNTPLFSDYAAKYRFVWMPPGTSALYRDDVPFEFPVGTVLVKSFAFPGDAPGKERLIETRLLVHSKSGWVGLPYIWNTSQTEATLDLAPNPVPVRYSDDRGKLHDFTYFSPNANGCKQCHENSHATQPIGPKARNLNKDFAYEGGVENQLARWQKIGYLTGVPTNIPKVARWSDPNTGTVEDRARAYLDINCAHCHQPGGTAGYTGVDLRVTSNILALGVCKSPNSAGRVGTLTYDLVPGAPQQSILVARMESTRPKEMMPQIGRSLVHEEGAALVEEWVKGMAPEKCAR